MPQPVLDAFRAEYGVQVTVLTYGSQEEAVANIGAEKVVYDIAVIELEYIPALVADDLVAEIDYGHVPNFKNISPNFRDLAFDPGSKHSVPYNWGTTGLLVRSDLVEQPITRWADLWDSSYPGKVAAREIPSELISVAVKSLGYPLNTENPADLRLASERLLELKSKILFVPVAAEDGVAPLLDGEATILVGWPGDAIYAQSQNGAITYIVPEEGSMLWGDSFVISAKSPNKDLAELFIDFLLRPEISAQIINTYSYPSANEMALPFVDTEIANNPIVYPPKEVIQKSEWYLPLGKEVDKLYNEIWAQFMTEAP
jgi:spermidine/putrescine transport system substrate-binding protein